MANKIESEFVNYEQALALKELGFDEKCIATIQNNGYIHIKGTRGFPSAAVVIDKVDVPLKQQVFRWFREMYGLHTIIDETVRPNIINKDSKLLFQYTNNKKYAGFEYEEAENACIDKLIELINNK